MSAVTPISAGGHAVPDLGQGQTIVPVDSYGSPTAAVDLAHFHATFFPKLPAPSFEQIFPQGNPQYHNTCHGNGLSGNCAAAGWSGECACKRHRLGRHKTRRSPVLRRAEGRHSLL